MLLPYDPAACVHLCNELDYARQAIDARQTMSRAWEGRLRRELESQAIAASTSMEGVKVTVDAVRQILAGQPAADVSEGDRRLVEGYRDAMSYVLRRSDAPGFRWQAELIVGLHDRVLAGNYQLGAGRFREKPVWVSNAASGETVFTPPAADHVPTLIAQLCEQLESSTDHPAVQAAWAHVALAAIHPFADGNGRAARVVASLAMHRGGFQRVEFTSLEEWWGSHLRDYYEAFRCLGPRFDPRSDVTPFIEAHVRAQVSQVRALRMAERMQSEMWTGLVNLCEEDHLEARLADGLWEVLFGRTLTAGYYRSITEVSPATATHDLGRMVAAGYLEPRGARRSRSYTAGPRLAARLAMTLRLEGVGEITGPAGDGPHLGIVHALAVRLSGLGSRGEAVRRLLDDCRGLDPERVEVANAAWAARFATRERRSLLQARRRVRVAIAETPAVRAAWARAQAELLAFQASTSPWRRHLEEGTTPETFAEAALMAVVAREVVALPDYCRLVESAAELMPWLAAECEREHGVS
jgi:Fic family protein